MHGSRGKPRSLRLVVTLTLSYLVVFFVPVVSMLLYYYPLTNRIISQKETNWTQYSIDQVRQTLDGVLTYIYDLPGDLINNQDLYLGSGAEDWDRWTTAREIRKHAKADRFIDNTFLYLGRDQYLYSVTGIAAPATALLQAETGYFYPGWPTARVLTQLASPRGILVRPAEEMVVPVKNRQRMVSFLVPVPLNSSHPVGTLLVLVREEPILDLIRPIAERNGGEVWITDGAGALILGVGPAGQPLATVPGSGSLLSRSTVSGWTVSTRYPVVSQLAEIREVQARTLAVSFGLLLLGALVIGWAVRFHSLPIKVLAQFARASFSQTPVVRENEWETIQGSLTTLRQASVRVRRDLLAKLVAGDFASRDEFHATARPFGLSLDHPFLTVALVAVEPQAPIPSDLLGDVHHQTDDGTFWVFEDPASEDRILLFCHRTPQFPQTCLAAGLELWAENPESRTVAGLGASTTDLLDLRTSLAEARRIADLLYLNQHPRWADSAVLAAVSGQDLGFPAEPVQILETAVRADDIETIRRTAETLMARLASPDLGPAMTRALWLSLMGILKTGQVHHGVLMAESLDAGRFGWSRSTRQQLVAQVDQELETLTDAVARGRGDKPEHERRRIEGYFRDRGNLTEAVGSLKDAADAFGMSESGFSRYFKKMMGSSFREFVEQKRIELSKYLLAETDDPVELIGQRVGYAPSNSSSFIRSFKRSVGMTPGQYRLHQNRTTLSTK